MPFAKRKTHRRRRKTARRSKRSKFNRRNTLRAPTTQPVANRFLCKMKYAETFSFPLSAGIVAEYFMNLNSTFDPDRSGVGHQPWGRDTMATLYNKYRVYKVKWCVVGGATATTDYVMVVAPVNHANTAGSTSAAIEHPRAVWKSSSLNAPSIKLHGSISLPSLQGQTPAQYKANEDCSAQSGSSPTEVMTLRINLEAPASVTGVPVTVYLTYYVEWFDPIDLGQS